VGQDIKLTASDGFKLGGYRADPAGTPKAAIVVIQEIFGVNHHIRAVCDRLADEGYVAIAPSIFDRVERNFQCGYSPEEVAVARKFVANPDWAAMLRDTQAAIDAVKDVGPVGIIGFCLGGSVAYAAATKLSGLSAAIGYYGGAIVRFADDKPKVPTQLHFGEKDAGIPTSFRGARQREPQMCNCTSGKLEIRVRCEACHRAAPCADPLASPRNDEARISDAIRAPPAIGGVKRSDQALTPAPIGHDTPVPPSPQ